MCRSTRCCRAPSARRTSPEAMSRRVAIALGLAACAVLHAAEPAPRWFKGNLHTHSLWSDGDDYPEMIADRYKQAGYHFLAISDHNVLAEGTRWLELKAPAVVAGTVVQPGGGSIHRRILSGVVNASQTSFRGALNARVRTMVVSVGVQTSRPLGFIVRSL